MKEKEIQETLEELKRLDLHRYDELFIYLNRFLTVVDVAISLLLFLVRPILTNQPTLIRLINFIVCFIIIKSTIKMNSLKNVKRINEKWLKSVLYKNPEMDIIERIKIDVEGFNTYCILNPIMKIGINVLVYFILKLIGLI